jgi:hypothetical protein
MADKPKTFAIVRKEAGDWEPFAPHVRPPDHEGWKVHAIMFEDGSIWDASNGWRPNELPYGLKPKTPADLRPHFEMEAAMKFYGEVA